MKFTQANQIKQTTSLIHLLLSFFSSFFLFSCLTFTYDWVRWVWIRNPLSASLQHNIGKLSPHHGGTFTNLKLVGSELRANSANFEPDSQMGLSLVGPILHTPNNQPSTASSLVLVCSLYRRKHVPTGTAQVVPHSCSTPNETKSQAIRAQCPYFINAMPPCVKE